MSTAKPEINPAFVQPTQTNRGVAYWVPSRSKDLCYLVETRNGALHCTCPARKTCCHIRAVEARIALDATEAQMAWEEQLDAKVEQELQERAEAVAKTTRQQMVAFYASIDTDSEKMDALYDTVAFWQDPPEVLPLTKSERDAAVQQSRGMQLQERRRTALAEMDAAVLETTGDFSIFAAPNHQERAASLR